MSTPLLQLDGVNTYYGDSHVLHDVSLAVAAGQVLTIPDSGHSTTDTPITAPTHCFDVTFGPDPIWWTG